jgi:hypothetical protein
MPCYGGQDARAPRIFMHGGEPKKHEVFALLKITPTLVIPAKFVLRESGGAGIRFPQDMDPRFRGGDVLTSISIGGPLAYDHSE